MLPNNSQAPISKNSNQFGITQVCDASALQECFKRNPTNRQEKCKAELEEFKRACEEKAKEFKQRTSNNGSGATHIEKDCESGYCNVDINKL
ncbi:hypothetical protein C9374_006938 [Naegleria lovaniensis]|uniref:Uncharacterized protein n=1 Tax=Naegleria lovaniensis TaxID=51637 RepID=A0AA88H613_NAELO|nr:uncharacterized protein C9374_006938 [Naegleria lovaniensis]KAG2393407.1 hypothetical protein C9374_006938 [Naegleria lovaniensis]